MQVVISDVIRMIKEGKTRTEIAEHYQLPLYVMQKNVFNHPKIKNLRTSKYYVNVIDDVPDENIEEVDETDTDVLNKNVGYDDELTSEPIPHIFDEI